MGGVTISMAIFQFAMSVPEVSTPIPNGFTSRSHRIQGDGDHDEAAEAEAADDVICLDHRQVHHGSFHQSWGTMWGFIVDGFLIMGVFTVDGVRWS